MIYQLTKQPTRSYGIYLEFGDKDNTWHNPSSGDETIDIAVRFDGIEKCFSTSEFLSALGFDVAGK